MYHGMACSTFNERAFKRISAWARTAPCAAGSCGQLASSDWKAHPEGSLSEPPGTWAPRPGMHWMSSRRQPEAAGSCSSQHDQQSWTNPHHGQTQQRPAPAELPRVDKWSQIGLAPATASGNGHHSEGGLKESRSLPADGDSATLLT